MRRIVAINGSPKTKGVSAMLLEQLGGRLQGKLEIEQAMKLLKTPEKLADILSADCLLIVYPLYVDALPAPLLKVLTLLEEAAQTVAQDQPLPKVYALCNCGYAEPQQISLSFKMLQHFCSRAGLTWQQGVAIGAGGFLQPKMKDLTKGPTKPIAQALDALAKAVDGREVPSGQNVFTAPQIPLFIYKVGATLSWHIAARKNGASGKLKARPHME